MFLERRSFFEDLEKENLVIRAALANGSVNLKFNNSVLVEKKFFFVV